MSRHHETKTAVIQNLAMRNMTEMTPVSFIAVCSALVPGGYTVTEIMRAFDSLVRERVLKYPSGGKLRGLRRSVH